MFRCLQLNPSSPRCAMKNYDCIYVVYMFSSLDRNKIKSKLLLNEGIKGKKPQDGLNVLVYLSFC